MTKKGVAIWSKTAASNDSIDSNMDWREGMAPSGVNDSGRGMSASVSMWRDDLNGTVSTAGGTTSYTATMNQSVEALAAGLEITVQVNATNAGTSTLAVTDGAGVALGAKPWRSAPAVELLPGAVLAGGIYRLTYKTSNSGEWIIQGYPVLGDLQVTAAKLASNSVTTAKILDDNVTLAKLVNASAQYRILGRKTSSAGDWEECTISEVLDMAGLVDGSSANGDILYRDTTWKSLPKGTDGQLLGLASGLPAWETTGRKLLATLTASNSASLSDTSSFTSAYENYDVEWSNLYPASGSTEVRLQVHSGGSFQTTGYITITHGIYTSGSGISYAPTTHIAMVGTATDMANAAPGTSGRVKFVNPSATAKCLVYGEYVYKYAAANYVGSAQTSGFWDTAAAVTGFRIIAASGNITAGKVNIYGYN